MKTYTYKSYLDFKKVTKFIDNSTSIELDCPSWYGIYEIHDIYEERGKQYDEIISTYYLSIKDDQIPNNAFVSVLSLEDQVYYTYSGCGITNGNVIYTNEKNKEQTHIVKFKFENYSYWVYDNDQLVKGGNLRKVVDDYASKYLGFTSWSVKFSDLETTLNVYPKNPLCHYSEANAFTKTFLPPNFNGRFGFPAAFYGSKHLDIGRVYYPGFVRLPQKEISNLKEIYPPYDVTQKNHIVPQAFVDPITYNPDLHQRRRNYIIEESSESEESILNIGFENNDDW
jgi:hypothetical protein